MSTVFTVEPFEPNTICNGSIYITMEDEIKKD